MKTIVHRLLAIAILLHLSFVVPLAAAPPNILNYQGRVAVGGVNFDGTGGFRFALVDAGATETYWTNDGTNTGTPGAVPTAAVSLAVTKGLYSLGLGDTTLANMTAVPASVFADHGEVYLRVWFDDGTNGNVLLAPDQRITSVGYALNAARAESVADGAVTGAMLAPGAVGGAQLASGLTLGGTTTGTFSGPLNGSATNFSGSLAGDITGTQGATAIAAGAIVNADVNAGAAIDATKLGTGVVNNTEFNYLNNVTSPIQTQFNGKMAKAGDTMTGMLTLPAGTTSLAPLKLQAGVNRTTPLFGAVEFDGTDVFVTNNSTTPTRKTLAFTDSTITAGQIANSSVTGAKLGADVGLWSVNGADVYRNSGNVGIGTTSPASPLTVNGRIETLSGGVKFPDGSVQTKAAPGYTNSQYLSISTGSFLCFIHGEIPTVGGRFEPNDFYTDRDRGTWTTAGRLIVAPVNLPAGAQVLSITFHGHDSNLLMNHGVYLVRKLNTVGEVVEAGGVAVVGAPGSFAPGDFSHTFNGGPIIDGQSGYHLQIWHVDNFSTNNDSLRIYNIVIEWRMP